MKMTAQQEGERLREGLRHFCEEKGMTFYMLAEKSEVPLTTIMHIMHGSTKNPGIFTVLRLCGPLGISLSELLDG